MPLKNSNAASPDRLLIDPRSAGSRIRLWPWFAVIYPAWLLLCLGVAAAGWRYLPEADWVWKLAALGLYLSLACNVIPLPTSPAVVGAAALAGAKLLEASAAQAGWMPKMTAGLYKLLTSLSMHRADSAGGETAVMIALIAVVGAAGTMMANLNEYHIWTGVLRSRKVAAVRQTRVYAAAVRWFAKAPWWTIAFFTLLLTPVDVVRVLAIAYRYPRVRFATACFVGRLIRYGLLCWLVVRYGTTEESAWLMVLAITALTVVAGVAVGLSKIWKASRHMIGRQPARGGAATETQA